MVTALSRGEWWANLSRETQDRLAADPGAPVAVDLGAEVNAASGRTDVYPPFRSREDHVLRGTFVAFIHEDNRALQASVATVSVTPIPDLERRKARTRRRGLIR